MTNLKDALTKKDEEMARLRACKTSSSGEKSSPRNGSCSPRRHSIGELQNGNVPRDKSVGLFPKAATDIDNCSEFSDKQSETSDEFRHHKEFFKQSRLVTEDNIEDLNDDTVLLGLGDADSEDRLSDISDGVLSMGTETDGSLSSIVELTLFPETEKAPVDLIQK